jgi:hypothetical protein
VTKHALPRPPCGNYGCPDYARSIVTWKTEDGIQNVLVCDNNEHLLWARECATGDPGASITRIGQPASLFHSNNGMPDHTPPFICASCIHNAHSRCDNKVPVRRAGALVVVECDCHAASHSMTQEVLRAHVPNPRPLRSA